MHFAFVHSHRTGGLAAVAIIKRRVALFRALMHLPLLSAATSSRSLCSSSATLCGRLARALITRHIAYFAFAALHSSCTLAPPLVRHVFFLLFLRFRNSSCRVSSSQRYWLLVTFVCFTFVALTCIAADETCRRYCRRHRVGHGCQAKARQAAFALTSLNKSGGGSSSAEASTRIARRRRACCMLPAVCQPELHQPHSASQKLSELVNQSVGFSVSHSAGLRAHCSLYTALHYFAFV